MTPEKLGRYDILGELGKGAMGVVYLAKDPLIGRRLAIKTFRQNYSAADPDYEQFRQRFLREARTAGALNHPNIVTIHDMDASDSEVYFIAMEYLEGTDLKQLMRREKLELRFVVETVAQVADGLGYAHSKGVIHRDVKPANIVITPEKQAKIMDFGIARMGASNLTVKGQLLGTPNYMSPEQIQGKEVDHRADLFSLGVLLYELITGRKPFQGDSLTVVSHRIIYDEYTSPDEYVPDLPPKLIKILEKALQKDPADRYQDGYELARELRSVFTAPVLLEPPAVPEKGAKPVDPAAPTVELRTPRVEPALAEAAAVPTTSTPKASPTPPAAPAASPPAPPPAQPSPATAAPPAAPPAPLASPPAPPVPAAARAEAPRPAPPEPPQPPRSKKPPARSAKPKERPAKQPPAPPAQKPSAASPPAPPGVNKPAPSARAALIGGLAVGLLVLLAGGIWGLIAFRGNRSGAQAGALTPAGDAEYQALLWEGRERLASGNGAEARDPLLRAWLRWREPAARVLLDQADAAASATEPDLATQYVDERLSAASALLLESRFERALEITDRVLDLGEDPRAREIHNQAAQELAQRQAAGAPQPNGARPPVATPAGDSQTADPPSAEARIGLLRIRLTTEVAEGAIRVIAGDRVLWEESFDFPKKVFSRKIKEPGLLEHQVELPVGTYHLSVGARVRAKKDWTDVEPVEVSGNLVEGAARVLQIALSPEAELSVDLQ